MGSADSDSGLEGLRRIAASALLCAVALIFTGACSGLLVPYSCTDAGAASTDILENELKAQFTSVTTTQAISDCDSGGELALMFRVTSFEAAHKELATASACKAAKPPRGSEAEGLSYHCRFQAVAADVFLTRAPRDSSEAVAQAD